MADQYVTSQGDTWDSIAYQVYGDEAYMQNLIEANQDYAGVFTFESGILIDLPDVPDESAPDAVPFWRRLTDDEMDAEEEGDDEYTDEEDEDEEEGDYPEEEEGDE